MSFTLFGHTFKTRKELKKEIEHLEAFKQHEINSLIAARSDLSRLVTITSKQEILESDHIRELPLEISSAMKACYMELAEQLYDAGTINFAITKDEKGQLHLVGSTSCMKSKDIYSKVHTVDYLTSQALNLLKYN